MNEFDPGNLEWEKSNGLIPAIIQDAQLGTVLMLGYMNQEALSQTLNTQKITFFSRSKKRLWVKGESSGNFLALVDIKMDCDRDTLLILAKPQGPTCHQGNASCFNFENLNHWEVMPKLEQIVQQRVEQRPDNSYTSQLLTQGVAKIAQKVGEEAVETVIAALAETDERLANESVDLIYHLLVLLAAKKLPIKAIHNVMQTRLRKRD